MNRSRYVFLSIALFAAFVLCVPAEGATLPAEVRTSTNAADAKSKVQPFIADNMTRLTGDDPTAQAAAKEALIAEVQTTGGVKPSDLFLDAYSDVLESSFRPLLKSPDVRLRLNLAVIAGRVSERSSSPRLTPTIVALLADENEAVALWAVKATKALIPPILNNTATAKTNPLIPALVAAAGKFVNSGPLIQSAYSSLSIEQAAATVTKQSWPTAVPIVAKAIQDIMSKRIEFFIKDGVPQMPNVEESAVTFLTLTNVWPQQVAQQQVDTVQVIANLISVSAQRVTSVNRSDRDSLVRLIGKSGSALVVIGLEAAGKPLMSLNAGTADPEVQTRAADMYTQIIKTPKFAAIKRPPTVTPAAAPTAAAQ